MKNTVVNVGFHGEVDFGHPASVSGVIANSCRVLSHQGYEFRILCDSSLNSYKEKWRNTLIFPFAPRLGKRGNKFYNWWKIGWISHRLISYPADIIHIHQKCELVLGTRALMKVHIPIIFHVNSHPEAWQGTRFGRALKSSDLVIASSKFVRSELIEKYKFPKGKVTVVYNGVDTRIFHPSAISKLERKKKYTVFFAGNIWIEKGFDVVLNAAKELIRDATFLIAGSFEPKSNLLHRKFQRDSPNNVRYLGRVKQSELARYYADADISIVPSKWEEPFGMVVVESMACGTPVIASRIGGIPELIDCKKNGLLVTPGSVRELVHEILWCKNNPKKLNEMGINARKKALKFDWLVSSEKLGRIYEKVLS